MTCGHCCIRVHYTVNAKIILIFALISISLWYSLIKMWLKGQHILSLEKYRSIPFWRDQILRADKKIKLISTGIFQVCLIIIDVTNKQYFRIVIVYNMNPKLYLIALFIYKLTKILCFVKPKCPPVRFEVSATFDVKSSVSFE